MPFTNLEVIGYLENMYGTEEFNNLNNTEKEQIIFTATELLSDEYDEDILSPRAVALQVLYILEGEGEEFSMLKRHGVKSYSVKDVSVTFEGDLISPFVRRLLGQQNTSLFGRLI